MSAVLETPSSLLPSRFAWLMGLYAENYHRLARLFAPARLEIGSYRSSLDDGLDVRLDVLERHRYTLDLHLTYDFVDAATGEASPSAQLRVYHDAHMAEVLDLCADRRLVRAIGPLHPARGVFQRRVRHPDTAGTVEGRGLGLHISRGLALANGGDLRLGDMPTGSRFELVLQRADAHSRP